MSDVFAQGLVWSQAMVIVDRIGWLLVHSVWQFAAVALLAFVLNQFLRRASAATRYRTLLTTMLLIVVAPIYSWQFLPSEMKQFATPLSQEPLESPELVGDRRELIGDGGEIAFDEGEPGGLHRNHSDAIPPGALNVVPAQIARVSPWSAVVTDAVQPWLSLIVCVWCMGVLLFSIRPLWSWYVVRRLTAVGVSPVAEAVQKAFDHVRVRMKIARQVRVLQSTLVNTPVVVGCFRSVILLPASFIAGVTVSQLEAILAHELAHTRRYDYLVNLLQTLVETLFFYHPAVWWLSHRIRAERENCCDDLVVAALDNRVEYGRALLAVEEFRGAPASSLALSASDGSLLARVRRLFADPPRDDQRSSAGLAALAVIASALLIAAPWATTLSEADDEPVVVEFGTTSRAGRWQITDDAELEITQKIFHATDVMTSGVIRLRGDNNKPRHLAFSIAADAFANRERWKAVWEVGRPVLWYVTGPGDGPGRRLPPGAKVKADDLRSINFSNPDWVVHHSYDGWVVDQLPSHQCRAALESEFEISSTGKENFRYYESAVAGLQPKENAEHLHVWIGENGSCQVEDPAWEMGQPSEVNCTLATLRETLTLVMKKFRDKKGSEVPVHAFIAARPKLPLADLRAVITACGQAGIHTPQEPGLNAGSTTEANIPNTPKKAMEDTPFRLPDHWIIEDVRWLNNDQQLLTASIQGGVNIRRWDMVRRRLLSEIKLGSDQHGRPVRQGTIQLSVDGSRVFAVTDGYVGVWDTSTGELLRQLPIPQKQWEYSTVHCLASSADGSVIVAGLGNSYSRTTMVYPSYGIAWDARSGAVLCMFEQEAGYTICDLAVTSDGRRFATCSEGHRVCLWETVSGKLLGDYSKFAHDWESPEPDVIKNNLVRGIDLSPDGKRLAIVGTFGIRLIDITSGNLLRTIDAPVRIGLGDAVFSPDGKFLARFGSRRGRQDQDSVLVWSVETGEQLSEFVASATIARFSNSGRQLALGESDFYEAISVWPMAGEKKLGPLPPPEATSLIDRVEGNTHYRGESAAEFAKRWQLSWGPARNGLQYGIALTSGGNRFRIGDRVPMVAFLKNTGEQPLQFDFRPDMFGNLPHVTTADGKPVELAKRDLLGQVALYRDNLEPGELFGPLYLNFGLGENPRPGTQEWTPHWLAPKPGVYELTHRVSIRLADPKATGDTTGPDWLEETLQSGSLKFEIISGNEVGVPLD